MKILYYLTFIFSSILLLNTNEKIEIKNEIISTYEESINETSSISSRTNETYPTNAFRYAAFDLATYTFNGTTGYRGTVGFGSGYETYPTDPARYFILAGAENYNNQLSAGFTSEIGNLFASRATRVDFESTLYLPTPSFLSSLNLDFAKENYQIFKVPTDNYMDKFLSGFYSDDDININISHYYTSNFNHVTSPTVKIHGFYTDILIEDKIPEISAGDKVISSDKNNPLTINEIKSMITVIDDYDGDISHLLEVENDNYTQNMDEVGIYDITFRVSDSSNNVARTTIKVYVWEDLPPTLHLSSKTINTSYNKHLTIDDITPLITYSDDRDNIEILTLDIDMNNYLENKSTVGVYNVTITVIDSYGNRTTDSLKIYVEDYDAPVFSYDDRIIIVQDGQNLTEDDLIKIVKGLFKDAVDFDVELLNADNIDYSILGKHHFVAKISKNSNIIGFYDFYVDVVEIRVPVEEDTNFIKDLCLTIYNFINEQIFILIITLSLSIILVIIVIFSKGKKKKKTKKYYYKRR